MNGVELLIVIGAIYLFLDWIGWFREEDDEDDDK